MRPTLASVLALVGAAGGLAFAGVSTYDFVAHLDRQVHGVHCSFLPGLAAPDVSGASGCHVTLMSPYSSVFRDSVWGGIPISLAAMGVFAFLLAFALYLILAGRQRDKSATGFMVAAALLPVFASIGMGYLAIVSLDAICKLCVGIYASSALVFAGAVWMRLAAGSDRVEADVDRETMSTGTLGGGALAAAFAAGVVFVAAPVGVYAAAAPDFSDYLGDCGALEQAPAEGVLVSLGDGGGSVDVIEILDPLCPACAGFERRFAAQSLATQVRRKALLFPLDSECNWMVDSRIHPGACAVSEAILCAGEEADEVLDWAFEEQERLREAETTTPGAAARLTVQRFPALAGCVGSPRTRARLNVALRWAVANRMPVLTPQVYVAGRRMCDEDTDLGMDWALSRLVERALEEGPHVPSPAEPAEVRRAAAVPARRPRAPAPAPAQEPVRVEVTRVDPEPAPVPAAAPAPAPVPVPGAAPAPVPVPVPAPVVRPVADVPAAAPVEQPAADVAPPPPPAPEPAPVVAEEEEM